MRRVGGKQVFKMSPDFERATVKRYYTGDLNSNLAFCCKGKISERNVIHCMELCLWYQK